MKKNPLVLRGPPLIPSFVLIATVVMAYLNLYTSNGEWTVSMDSLSFSELSAFEIYGKIMLLLIPASLFLTILFLGEKSLRWVVPGMLVPVVWQISNYIYYWENLDALLSNPLQYSLPFVGVVLFALTVEGILPTKWIFVGGSFVMALLPVLLTLCGVGEFIYEASAFDSATYQMVDYRIVDWSSVFYLFLYYAALGFFGIALKREAPTEKDAEPSPTEEAEAL